MRNKAMIFAAGLIAIAACAEGAATGPGGSSTQEKQSGGALGADSVTPPPPSYTPTDSATHGATTGPLAGTVFGVAPTPVSPSDSSSAVTISGAKIDVKSGTGSVVLSTLSIEDGTFSLPSLTDGDYELVVTLQGPAALTWANGGIDRFTVKAGRVQARGNLDVWLLRR